MKHFIAGFFAAVLVLVALPANAKLVGTAVEYDAKGVIMKSYIVYDDKIQGKRPGILVFPEWWGVNDYVRIRANMLAELGYTAMAVDMYGGGKQASTPGEAKEFSSQVMKNFDAAKARFAAATDFLKKQSTVDPTRIAAVGYCFGSGVALNLARQGADLKGVVSFHGDLTSVDPAKTGSVKAKILVLTGGDDSFVPPEQVEAFKREMEAAGADFRIVCCPGAKHSFTSPEADALGKKFNLPVAYNPEADRKAWAEMKKFLETIFKQ